MTPRLVVVDVGDRAAGRKLVELDVGDCATCGRRFEAPRLGEPRRYCSAACRDRRSRSMTRQCPVCTDLFEALVAEQMYCSPGCEPVVRRQQQQEAIT